MGYHGERWVLTEKAGTVPRFARQMITLTLAGRRDTTPEIAGVE